MGQVHGGKLLVHLCRFFMAQALPVGSKGGGGLFLPAEPPFPALMVFKRKLKYVLLNKNILSLSFTHSVHTKCQGHCPPPLSWPCQMNSLPWQASGI